MKRKIIFAIAASFFTLATMLNINMLQETSVDNVSLSNIAMMAQAQEENKQAYNDLGAIRYDTPSPGDNSGDKVCYGSIPEKVTVHCKRYSSGAKQGEIYGEVHADLKQSWGTGNVHAGGSGGGSSNTQKYSQVVAEWVATGINCIPRHSPDKCTSHFPC